MCIARLLLAYTAFILYSLHLVIDSRVPLLNTLRNRIVNLGVTLVCHDDLAACVQKFGVRTLICVMVGL